jgi:hypothetical protein
MIDPAHGYYVSIKLRTWQAEQSKAVFHFEVRGYSEAHHFKERGVNQICPGFRLTDCTDYESKEMVALFGFGANEIPWDDIWMPSSPTYSATRGVTWKVRPKQLQLALRQKYVYERNKTDLLTGGAGAGGAGGAGTSAISAKKMAATLAAQVNSATGSIDKFTSVFKTSGGGAKRLRSTTTTRKLEDQWT